MSKDIAKAEKNVEEINRRLGEIEKKAGKIEIPIPRNVVKRGIKRVISILKKMVEEDTDEYSEIGDKKIGNVRVQHGLKIRFLDGLSDHHSKNDGVTNLEKKRKLFDKDKKQKKE